jgi:exopolyphosphatase / guanosine-5'-triphosphate,3'-diphosphate pyrophosphatase
LETVKQFRSLAEHTDSYRDSERVAIIDMGSNSWRLIVVEYVPSLSFKLVDEVRETVRIGEGMAELNVLRPAAMDRAVRAAQIYAGFCRAAGITDIVAVGTSAIRDARNQARFVERVRAESGLTVRVLSGEEEAFYGYLAAVNSTTLENGFVVDMGGGSLQISRVENRLQTHSVSFPLGAVRLTEGFLTSDPATPKEVQTLVQHLDEQFGSLPWFKHEPGMRMICEGGGLRLIGRMAQKRLNYPLDLLHGYRVPLAQVTSIRDELAKLTIAARRKLPGMKSDRADLSLANAVALSEVMRVGGFDEMTVCSQGLREGVFYERFFAVSGDSSASGIPMFEDVRRASVINLAHIYRYQQHHAEHIAHLTLSMFDQLPPELHDLGAAEREILWAASILHDIGVTIDYHDHHKHGSYLILNGDLPGFTHRELALIALLVRYHRKGKPTPDELTGLLDAGDERRLIQLCALLRLAEQIDRSRDGVVRDVTLHVSGGHARLELLIRSDDELGYSVEQVPVWAVEHNRDIFEEAFQMPLEVVPVPE